MDALLETIDLKKYFRTPRGMLHAVDGVNLKLDKGKTIGVVGESGCGKSTLGRTILRLLEPTSGQILFKGKDITKFTKRQIKNVREDMQIIFQDPYASLNPRMTVGQIIGEPLRVNKKCKNKNELDLEVYRLMDLVGLDDRFINTFPHELDGGRRQRIGVARALSLKPDLIVCDEPVSALDVSIQAQILNLLMDLQDKMGISYIFITHDLSVVKHISDDIMVMYLGQCIERCSADALFEKPLHPYTKALLSAIPIPELGGKSVFDNIIHGEVVDPIEPKPGCRFAARCPHASAKCTGHIIKEREVGEDHFVSCVLYDE